MFPGKTAGSASPKPETLVDDTFLRTNAALWWSRQFTVGILCTNPNPWGSAVPDPSAPNHSGMDDIPSPLNAEAALPLGELRALADRLASARQAAGITLEELAGRLCIGQDQLRALETADVNHLPELVFVIAQARRVAAILGIDAEDTIKHLRAAHRPRPVGASTSTQASAGRTTTIPTRPLRATGAAGFKPGGSWRPAAALLGLGAALAGGLLVLSSLGRNQIGRAHV